MNREKFNKDYDWYKANLSLNLDEDIVNLMLHAYCMGYCELTNHLHEEFDFVINLDPVLEKITELNPLLSNYFE